MHVIRLRLSLSSIRFYPPAWFNSSEQKRSPVEIARFRGFNDGRIKDTWLPTRFYTIHNFVGFHLSFSHEPPFLPSLVAHPPPNARLLRIFREVLSLTLLNLERDYCDVNFRRSTFAIQDEKRVLCVMCCILNIAKPGAGVCTASRTSAL